MDTKDLKSLPYESAGSSPAEAINTGITLSFKYCLIKFLFWFYVLMSMKNFILVLLILFISIPVYSKVSKKNAQYTGDAIVEKNTMIDAGG